MKYLGVLLAGILIVAWVPGSASAQSLPAGLGLPSLGGLLGGGGCAPLCDPKAGGGLDFWVGYLVTNRSVVGEFSAKDQDLAGVLSARHQFPVQGVWVALSAYGSINEQVGLYARGSWLFASGKQTNEDYSFGGGAGLGLSRWSTRPQWYTIEGAGLFSFSPVSLIGGFRYDSFQANFDRSRDFFGIAGLQGDDADLTVTSYIPYVGLLVQQGSALKVGFIGFPYVPGSVKYRETAGAAGPAVVRFEFSGSFRTSYFLEAFAEYGMNLMGGNVGIFGIWTYLHGRANVSADANFVGFPGIEPGQTFDFGFDRQNWIFGGKFGISFTSPM